jgi:ABC-type Na+ transport system ATPase subunit NatA
MLPTQTALDSLSLINFEKTGQTSLIVFDQPRLIFSPGSDRVLRDFLNQETEQRCIISGSHIVERLADGAICLHSARRSTALSVMATERLREVLNQATEQSEHEEESGNTKQGGV